MPWLARSIPCRLLQRRAISASARRWASFKTVDVPCQSNGSIKLDIHYPSVPPQELISTTVGIYLPRGPLLPNAAHDASNLSLLRSVGPYPIVQINYRCDREHQYPTPIHDVLAGYDWITQHLLPTRTIARTSRFERLGRLFVCGEFLGGQLAAMLALTECRAGEPGIVAACVNNPITDWVSIDPGIETRAAVGKAAPATPMGIGADELLQLRNTLFAKPDKYFDPFASPTLFFRSAGVDVPPDREASYDDMAELAYVEREDFFREQLALSTVSDEDTADDVVVSKPKKRKASKRYPSKLLGLRLPPFRLSVGKRFTAYDQVHEFAGLLGRSLERQAKGGADRAGRQHVYTGVPFEEHPDLGLWDDTVSGRSRVHQAVTWLAEQLNR